MAVYGLFNDEGQVEGDFHSYAEAKSALETRYNSDDELEICECCPNHTSELYDHCEMCEDEEELEDDT